MALPALVLVHGGQHAADCWDLTVDEIHRQAPGLTVSRSICPDGATSPVTFSPRPSTTGWTHCSPTSRTRVRRVRHRGPFDGGAHRARRRTKLGPSRVREMVLAAAFVPPQGAAVVDTLPGLMGGTHGARPTPACPGHCRTRWRSSCSATG